MKVAFVYMNNERNVGRGAGYVAGAVLRADHQMDFFDTAFTPLKTVTNKVISGDYDVLMISTMTMIFPEASKLARLVKQQSNIPILVGGVHPTIVGGPILTEHPEIDYLCIGEGESMVVDFLAHLGKKTLFNVPNLAFRHNGTVQVNSYRPAEDLAELPPFPWHLFPKHVLRQRNGFIYVHATRGCPFNCHYCCNVSYLKLYGKQYLRFRPVEHIIDELKFLHKAYDPQLFYFGDEMFLSDPKYAVDLVQSIRKELDIPYGCMARVEYLTPEIVEVFADTGCRYMGLGVECGDEEFRRKYLNRRISNAKIEQAFELVKRTDIFVSSFNMIGYPFEFDDRLTEETVKLNQKINPGYVQISIFYPFPGTQLYQHCLDLDLIDYEKLATTKDYFKESVLKGVSLQDKRDELDALLNPKGFHMQLKEPTYVQTIITQLDERLGIRIRALKIKRSVKHWLLRQRLLVSSITLVRDFKNWIIDKTQ